MLLSALSLLTLGHAFLRTPIPRDGTAGPNGRGYRLTPFSDARQKANHGCGGAANGGLTVQRPTQVYQQGLGMPIRWRVAVPHNADVRDTGLRVAIHYAVDDSFECNVLLGGAEGEDGFQSREEIRLNAASAGAVARPNPLLGNEFSTMVTLPAGKTCDYCVLQWMWAARDDNGFYLSCADIAITADGQHTACRSLATVSQFATLDARISLLVWVAASGRRAVHVEDAARLR